MPLKGKFTRWACDSNTQLDVKLWGKLVLLILVNVTSCAHKRTYTGRSYYLKRPSVRLYLQLFVGGFMYYIRFVCLFAYDGVQHISCCVFAFFFFVLYVASFSGLSIFWLRLRYSLTFIYNTLFSGRWWPVARFLSFPIKASCFLVAI